MDDIHFSTGAIAAIGVLLAALAGTISKIFYMLIAAKDVQVADLKAQLEGANRLAERYADRLEDAVDLVRKGQGLPPFTRVAPVVADHNSPVTPEQAAAAGRETLKARYAAASLQLAEMERVVASAPPPAVVPAGSVSAELMEGVRSEVSGTLDKIPVASEVDARPGSDAQKRGGA